MITTSFINTGKGIIEVKILSVDGESIFTLASGEVLRVTGKIYWRVEDEHQRKDLRIDTFRDSARCYYTKP